MLPKFFETHNWTKCFSWSLYGTVLWTNRNKGKIQHKWLSWKRYIINCFVFICCTPYYHNGNSNLKSPQWYTNGPHTAMTVLVQATGVMLMGLINKCLNIKEWNTLCSLCQLLLFELHPLMCTLTSIQIKITSRLLKSCNTPEIIYLWLLNWLMNYIPFYPWYIEWNVSYFGGLTYCSHINVSILG